MTATTLPRRSLSSLLEFGVSAAIVIAALSLLLFVTHRHQPDHGPPHEE